jgi:hypothetical protein
MFHSQKTTLDFEGAGGPMWLSAWKVDQLRQLNSAYAYAKILLGFNMEPPAENCYRYWPSQLCFPYIHQSYLLYVILLYFFSSSAMFCTKNGCYTEPRFQCHVCMMYMYSICIHKPVFLYPSYFIFNKYSLYCFYKHSCCYLNLCVTSETSCEAAE